MSCIVWCWCLQYTHHTIVTEIGLNRSGLVPNLPSVGPQPTLAPCTEPRGPRRCIGRPYTCLDTTPNSSKLPLCCANFDPVQPYDSHCFRVSSTCVNHCLLGFFSVTSQLVHLCLAHCSLIRSWQWTMHCNAIQGWSPLRCAIAAWKGPTSAAATPQVGESPRRTFQGTASQVKVMSSRHCLCSTCMYT